MKQDDPFFCKPYDKQMTVGECLDKYVSDPFNCGMRIRQPEGGMEKVSRTKCSKCVFGRTLRQRYGRS